MPYTVETAPPDVRKRFTGHCLEVWATTFNDTLERHDDEGRSFATAELAGQQCEDSKMTNSTKAAMPDNPAAMRMHMMADPPAGHGMEDAIQTAAQMEATHKAMHADGAEHDHPGMPMKSEMKMAVKFAEGSDTEIEGLAIPFGVKDLDGEDFGPDTDLQLEWFPDGGRPILYHHGFDPAMKTAIVGREQAAEIREEGLWVKAQLDKASRYYGRVKQLVEQGAVGWSSGTIERLFEATKAGHITRWPVVEYSLTPTPAMPNRVTYAVKAADSMDHLSAVETDVPVAIKTMFDSDNGSESEPFASQAERVTASLDAFAERVMARVDARVKSGRVLSAANRAEIAEVIAAIDQLRDRRDRLADLIARTDPEAADATKAMQAEYLAFLAYEARRNGVDVPFNGVPV